MTRLMVDEGGARRSFKVGDGVLTIGSGEGAALRLKSTDVAELHAELDVRGDRVYLRARPGVVAPTVGGQAVSGEHELDPGARIEIGGASIVVEFSGPGRAGGGADGAAPAPVVRGAGRGARGKGRHRSASRRAAGRRRQKKSSMVTLGVFAGVVVLIVIFVQFIAPALFDDPQASFDPLVHYNRASNALDAGRPEEALAELDGLAADSEVSASMAAKLATLRTAVERELDARALMRHNAAAGSVLEGLRDYEREHLQGRPERPAVRLYLERLAAFLEEWPEHPETSWAQRMQTRYAAQVSLDERPSFEDLEFEVRLLITGNPRRYGEAIAAIDAFVPRTISGEGALATELRAEVAAERKTWFEDKLQRARAAYDEGERGKSVAWLVLIVEHSGDPLMAAEAAEFLVRFVDLDEWLRGYRSSAPQTFEALVSHPSIREYVAEHPLD